MNCQAVAEAEKNMVFAARLTQQGHKIASMDDLMELYEKSFSVQTVAAMGALPHPTIQKFAVITVAIVGASRRFLAQITRHQNEVKFMSASLQYSNYTGQADFAVPYSIMTAPAVVQELYLKSCNESMKCYEDIELMTEALYHINCDYLLSDYLQWPMYDTKRENPFRPYFELWKMGLNIYFPERGRVVLIG